MSADLTPPNPPTLPSSLTRSNSSTRLTRHNPQLQGLKNEQKPPANPHLASQNAIACNRCSVRVLELAQNSLSSNTQTAYLSDLQHFISWGGQIPASSESIAEYLAAHAETLSIATLTRRLAALAKIHRSQRLDNPTTSELVRSALRRRC